MDTPTPVVSVIIPVLNEEKALSENFSRLRDLSRRSELIFVDGGSSDGSAEIAGKIGRVLHSSKGRAAQMNFGARAAEGEVLLFLHADAFVSPDAVVAIEEKVTNGGSIGGCLRQRIDKNGAAFRLLEGFGNTRAVLTRVFYGDQGIFVEKKVFFELGAFPEVPVMEDVMFTKKMRRRGRTAVLRERIFSSPRRWESEGILKTSFLYSLLNVMFWLGIPTDRIKKLYGNLR